MTREKATRGHVITRLNSLNNTNQVNSTSCSPQQSPVDNRQFLCKSNLVKEQLMATRNPECGDYLLQFEVNYCNNLRQYHEGFFASKNKRTTLTPQRSDCDASPFVRRCTDTNKSERRRRRRRRALSWACALLCGPCWCFYQLTRTHPDADDGEDAKREYSTDFCCPCHYDG